jgi:hypothetical protein
MAEDFADEIEAVPTGYGYGGEAVPKVVDPDITETGNRSYPLPGPLYADEMAAAPFGGQNIRGVFPIRQPS